MILVDTNVVSEPMKAQGDLRVAAWLDRQSAETLFIATISIAEILFGVAALPAGRGASGSPRRSRSKCSVFLPAASCPSTLRRRGPTPRS